MHIAMVHGLGQEMSNDGNIPRASPFTTNLGTLSLDLRGVAIRDGAGARPAAALFLRST